MSNLVELSNELEFVPKEQLIQMSQDPNSTYPSYLVLSEIKRRTQMEKMYAAQQPKPETTVSDELVAEFAGSPSGLGAMAQSSDIPNAFQSGEMGNMAPPSPLMTAASGGLTGYQAGGLTDQTIKEANALGIDIKNLSDEEIVRRVKLANNKRRKDMLLGMTPDANQFIFNQSLPTSPEDLLNLGPIPAGLQAQINAAKEPSKFDKVIEGGTQFFFGDPRPDAERPNLARATDEFTDYLSLVPGATASLKLGASGLKALIQGGKAFKQSGKLDDLIDLTKVNPSKINQADNILPIAPKTVGGPPPVPRIGGTPPTVPRIGGTPPTSGPTLGPTVGPPRPPGTNLVPQTGTNLVPQTGTNLVPQGGPLAVIPKVTKESKGLINRAVDWIKNNKKTAFGFGLLGGGIGSAAYYSGEPDKEDNGAGGAGSTAPTTKEIKKSIDPLDLAKLGGIIMAAKNTSELGQGITALAGDIQERRYKEKVLTSKEEQMLYTRLNAISKAIDEYTGDQEAPEYKRLIQARDAAVAQINTLYGPITQGTDPMSILNANTIGGTDTKDTEDTSSGGLGGALKKSFIAMNPILSLGGMGLKAGYEYLTKDDEVNNTIIPQQDLYNAFIKNAPNPQYLTGDPYIDNIMRIESGGRDVVNDTTGATGPMQVLPSTLQDPGYNIEPAKNNSVEEKIRVGVDYFYKMVDKYNGDIFLGTLAFNLGPGNVDTWLNSGGDINTLKSITSKDGRQIGEAAYDYVVKAYGQDAVNRILT